MVLLHGNRNGVSMDKWGMVEKVVFIGLIWIMIICLLYGMASGYANQSGDDTMTIFLIYMGQTVQLVYYFTMPILLFLIACALLKDK